MFFLAYDLSRLSSLGQLALFLIALFVLTACGSQAATVQITPPDFLPSTATNTPAPTTIATITPCLGFVATSVGTPLPWSYADNHWDKIAISRIPIQGRECTTSQEIVRKLVLQWLETIKTNSPTQEQCGLEDYSLDNIMIKENTITPQYDIVAGVGYHVKPGRFGDCGWISDRGQIEKMAGSIPAILLAFIVKMVISG